MDDCRLPSHLASLNEIEKILGDPLDKEGMFFTKEVMKRDEYEQYPKEQLDKMHKAGLTKYFVPKEYGGDLQSCPHCYYLARSISTRDITAAVTFLLRSIGNWAVLVAGTEEQKKYCSDAILNGSGISWGVTEKEFGSDLISNGTYAEYEDNRYYLTGEKWPIGNCHYNDLIMVLARTSSDEGPSAFSLFCVDKNKLNQAELIVLPSEKLYGLRAMDLSGVLLDQCSVSPNAIIGGKGEGLEVMLRAQQVNRAGIVAISTGAMDTALRMTLNYANKRQLFGQSLGQTPVTKLQLVDAFTDLLLCEAQANFVTRALHLAPKSFFIWAALSKFTVPTLAENTLLQLSDVIGARHFLRESFYFGFFQKICRDNLSVGFVDGNKKVNLKNIALHMELQLNYFNKKGDSIAPNEEYFPSLFDYFAELPDVNYEKLGVFSGREDPVLLNFKHSIIMLEEKLIINNINNTVRFSIIENAKKALQQFKDLYSELVEKKKQLGKNYNYSPESFALAEKYSMLYLAPTCIHMALYSSLTEHFADFIWLDVCLLRVQRLIDPNLAMPTIEQQDQMFNLLTRLNDDDLAFTFIPIVLPKSSERFDETQLFNL